MELNELRKLISESDPTDWYKLEGYGPYFHNRFSLDTRSETGGVYELGADSHHTRAIYRGDIDLAIEWGIDPENNAFGNDQRELKFEWAEAFPDSEVGFMILDVFWRNSLVERYELAIVDGSRAYLPAPQLRATKWDDDHVQVLEFENRVGSDAVKIAAVVNELVGHGDYYSYLERAGFKIVDQFLLGQS